MNEAYEKMKVLISEGKISNNFDFYGYSLSCYDLEDNEETQIALVFALEYGDKYNGYLDTLEMFHNLVKPSKDIN